MIGPFANYVLFLLASTDPQLVKRGLQEFCGFVEDGGRLPKVDQQPVTAFVVRALSSSDVLVRRWAYKAVGLLRIKAVVPKLRAAVAQLEADDENLTWAIAALARVSPAAQYPINRETAVTPNIVRLSTGYFDRTQRPSSARELRKLVTEGSALTLQWASLLYGASKGRMGTTGMAVLVRELTAHSVPIVSEYAIWSLVETPTAHFEDVRLLPYSADDMPPNVRRWFLRLLTKEEVAMRANMAIIERHVAFDPDAGVREGLAIGLRPYRLPLRLQEQIVDWFWRETSPLVRAQLIRHFAEWSDHGSAYSDALDREGHDPRDALAELLVPRVRRASRSMIIMGDGSIGGRVSMRVPDITRHELRETYVVAVDTVDFSSNEDAVQLTVLRDLLRAAGDVPVTPQGVPPAILLTGDGLIVAFGDPDATSALHFAERLFAVWSKTKRLEVRVGVNSGPSYWLKLTDGTTQLIGHAINWAVRVMGGLPGPGISISGEYYDRVVRPRLMDFRGLAFEEVDGRVTKKGEPIRCYDVNAS